ncbi:glycosyltransferase [Flavobacterium sp. 245]|uniref:glycosyltransferase n=1 Tax=Flavobacterium sp. 245 TaxID=2512115 RepID=UPI00105DF575|nr:glycosyltransferase [Flavobacterium sp. 245]TDP00853.1 glycosyltransferase involved in cell wall biosynthesis [Flavobacterium sp. 245]
MKLVVITHVVHIQKDGAFWGYAPYVREMNIWFKYIDEVAVVAPLELKKGLTEIDTFYECENIDFKQIPNFNFTSLKNILNSIFKLPLIFWQIFWAMYDADHIHLRCPGNVGLIGCLAQIFFPNKKKTAKYAGNWDSESKQPLSYRLQKWILSNSFLTKNMQVLVYGDWPDQSKNIKPFFTATYSEAEKEIISKNSLDLKTEFIFVGSLVSGKNALYAIKLIQELVKKGINAVLNVYGNGIEKNNLEIYISDNKLEGYIVLHGNQNKETVRKAYQKSHFVILPSKSEGWPKAIAEGMFWGCVPVATNVSCVPFMLDYGNRGILLKMNLEKDVVQLNNLLENKDIFMSKSKLAQDWSQNYTTDFFETEIKNLL